MPSDFVPTQRHLRELVADNPILAPLTEAILRAYELLSHTIDERQFVLVCGNGGSASDAEHIAGELAKSCALKRPLGELLRAGLSVAGDDGYLAENLEQGFAVLPLVSQAALITAILNDQGGDLIFAQQVLAYGRPGGLLWALSSSGNSPNVIHALRTARALGMGTLGFSGPDGGHMAELCDVIVPLPGDGTPEVQHHHQLVYHAICLALERARFAS